MSSFAPFDDARTKLTAAALGYPIAWPNTTFKRPKPPAPFLSVECVSHNDSPIELSGASWQEDGTLYVDVAVPAGTGTDLARTIAKNVFNVFRGIYVGPVIYNGGSIGNGSIVEADGMWWVITVAISWKFQDTSGGTFISDIPTGSALSNLPTTLPGTPGQLWNNGGVLCIS